MPKRRKRRGGNVKTIKTLLNQSIIIDGITYYYDSIYKRVKSAKMYSRKGVIKVIIPIKYTQEHIQHYILPFIKKHIVNMTLNIQKSKYEKRIEFYNQDQHIFILGKKYKANFFESTITKYYFFNDIFYIHYVNKKELQELIQELLLVFGNSITKLSFDKWLKIMKINYDVPLVWEERKSWLGLCCYFPLQIKLKYSLLTYDIETIESVMVHEIAHLYVHNHSKRFWNVVYHYLPNYKHYHKKLKASIEY